MGLVLRPFVVGDEAAALAAARSFEGTGFTFLLGYEPLNSFGEWVATMARWREGRDLPDGIVPAAMLAADVDGVLVGRVSVRFALTEYLATYAGHIGYAVLAEHRRRGYATEMLARGLGVARAAGIDPVLVTCDDSNVASASVIERNGGVLESVVTDDEGRAIRRYWLSGEGAGRPDLTGS